MSSPFDFFEYKRGKLSVQGISLEKIAKRIGTPAYIYSSEALLRPLRDLQSGLTGIDHLVCFAVKANSNLSILKLLAESGAGTDLVSGGELFRALKAGVPPSRIVFSGVGKTPDEIREALTHDIFSFNVESVAELELLNRLAEKAKKTAAVTLRFNPDVDAKTHPYISTGLKKNKFGLEKAEVLEIARRSNRLGSVRIQGLSIHIGSQLVSLKPLNDAFTRMRKMRARVEAVLGRRLEVMDLGGGVGITYKNERPPSVAQYCRLIQKHFGPESGESPVKVVVEPGRSLAGNAGVLLTQVLYRKPRGKKDFIVVDAAMNDLARPALYGSYHDIVPLDQSAPRGSVRTADVVGPVCESTDCFASDRKLPARLASGDLLAILSAGAYGFTMSSNYNTRPRPPEVLVHEGEARLIRRRETLHDLIEAEIPKGDPHARNLHGTDLSLHSF